MHSHISKSGIVELYDYPSAKDISYFSLIQFLKDDTTDQRPYQVGTFVCTDFAETVQHNAELAGINCAWVSLGGIQHAIDAFNTTDKGLAYIDCTGSGYIPVAQTGIYRGQPASVSQAPASWDKVAYVETGKAYGVISLDYASDVSYTFYEDYETRLANFKSEQDSYNEEVEQFQLWQAGRTIYVGTPDAWEQNQWYNQLESERSKLERLEKDFGFGWGWDSLGIVKSVDIYWPENSIQHIGG
jgi:hypothetical protein